MCVGLDNSDPNAPRMIKGKCESDGHWSNWYDRDDTSGNGDYEMLVDQNAIERPCGKDEPIAAECQTVGGLDHALTGLTFVVPCGVTGIACRNSDNPPNGCQDMRIRYRCPGSGADCKCEMPLGTSSKVKTSQCTCCSDYTDASSCKKHKCTSQKKKKGTWVMKSKKCKWKNDQCKCKSKKPLEMCDE